MSTNRASAQANLDAAPAAHNSGAVGLLLVGMTAAPAQAETIREQQWYLTAMKADQMWRTSTGKGITVAVIDTGVDGNLPDLKGRGIRYAVDSGAQVINISMRAYKGSDELTAAVKYALNKGALIFAGSGNDGTSEFEYPAGAPGVVAVGAVGRNLSKTKESQYGPQIDMAAPGDEMYHACPNGKDLCRSHGTSDATALASASAALIWSKHPTWTNNQVLRVMLNTIGGPTNGAKRNDSIGYGIVRPRIALQNPGDPGPANVYPLPDFSAVASSASPSAATAGSKGSTSQGKDGRAVAEASSDKGGSDTRWVALGVGAVVLIGGVVAAVVTRKRRRSAA
ncbi:S8 family serine peptidase [Streptomyces collinus]|uniref:S8 family serine peptidase n=1 Tax=Streptomyces collinus TaxID=42684 RepID=UPI0036E5072C